MTGFDASPQGARYLRVSPGFPVRTAFSDGETPRVLRHTPLNSAGSNWNDGQQEPHAQGVGLFGRDDRSRRSPQGARYLRVSPLLCEKENRSEGRDAKSFAAHAAKLGRVELE